jgi:hypothetical protein
MDMTATPQGQTAEAGSESSSGKKRRARPSPLELGGPLQADTGPATGSPIQATSARSAISHGAYLQPTPASEPPLSAIERRDRDIRMEGTEEYQQAQQQQQPQPQPQQHRQQQQQQQQQQTTTPRSFKETVGM